MGAYCIYLQVLPEMGAEMVTDVQVILATYEGEAYLEEQLDSLKAQTCPFTCLIGDDGSLDRTVPILKDWALRDTRFCLAPGSHHLGATGNFLRLLRSVRGPVACCDQDDIWESDRLLKGMKALEQAEKQYGADTPILIHSDLAVMDAGGQILHASFMRHQHWDPLIRDLPHLLVQNNVTGCTCLMNEPLRALVADHARPEELFMHDWFFAQTAAAFGQIVYVDEPLVRYRQHAGNVVGASHGGILLRALKALSMPGRIRERLQLNDAMAKCLLNSYDSLLPERERKIILDYLQIRLAPGIKRPRLLREGGYLMQSRVARMGQYLFTS